MRWGGSGLRAERWELGADRKGRVVGEVMAEGGFRV